MPFPCTKCLKYDCDNCELILEYERKKERQEEKRHKTKILQKGKGSNANNELN